VLTGVNENIYAEQDVMAYELAGRLRCLGVITN
jgi:hypothetical protein